MWANPENKHQYKNMLFRKEKHLFYYYYFLT
uniref:Uncharacterized protein n=1 Tax=Anguilla anguilla TaxID=7936 RepID=A0A0E9Q705_ANGAN